MWEAVISSEIFTNIDMSVDIYDILFIYNLKHVFNVYFTVTEHLCTNKYFEVYIIFVLPKIDLNTYLKELYIHKKVQRNLRETPSILHSASFSGSILHYDSTLSKPVN